jgi:hypothetical protein
VIVEGRAMDIERAEGNWGETSEAVISALKEWRAKHPKATFREIEAAVDEELGRLRRQMLTDAALVSQATGWEANSEGIVCPQGTCKVKYGTGAEALRLKSN